LGGPETPGAEEPGTCHPEPAEAAKSEAADIDSNASTFTYEHRPHAESGADAFFYGTNIVSPPIQVVIPAVQSSVNGRMIHSRRGSDQI